MEELRTYWEVPAVAHFCSLFRAVFKLIDFDIEDFEEALIVDTESAPEGGRSSLIVDVLTALLRGCLGRRDVTLLNYNQFLHDLLSHRWTRAGYGQNPLGVDRERACFHILPLYAKVKILHCLCEWRLERPDVEVLTRDLAGDSLRVVPLGRDHGGSTYWYFYGTRLYREDPVVEPKTPKKGRSGDGGNKTSTPRSSGIRRGKRKRRRRNYDFTASKKAKSSSPKKRGLNPVSSGDSSTEDNSDAKRGKFEQEFQNEATEQNATPDITTEPREYYHGGDENGEDSSSQPMQWKPKLEANYPTENTSMSSFPATPASSSSNAPTTSAAIPTSSQQDDTTSFADIVKRIYSRDEDDDDTRSEKRSTSEFGASEILPASLKSEITSARDEPLQEQEIKVENGIFSSNLKKPYIPEGPPPWDQPDLCPLEAHMRGWSLACSTLEDWNNLADSFGKPKDKNEIALCEVLRRDFLPVMQDLFDQKEKERLQKLAELAPRRTSDRLEVKRLQKDREDKILAERERQEIERLTKNDDERQRRLEQEKREQRARLRELEKEKRHLIKERAREERGRRLQLRQMKQQLMAEGKEIPEDLLNLTGGAYANEQELNELDIEIELEHMYGQLEKLLDQLKETEDAEPFVEPVKEEIAPDYHQVIENPMDLTKIEDKLLGREYKNKAEFVQDINLILLNCLQYNGLQSEYTKVAQRLERTFIKAWKRFFPPSDLEDSGEDARQEELHCISLLGALDKKLRDEILQRQRVEAEQRTKLALDKKELQRQRKREADRRRRRIKADEKRRLLTFDQEQQLASQSLSSLTGFGETPKRQAPPPFLVGSSSTVRRPVQMPARAPDGKFLPGSLPGSSSSSRMHEPNRSTAISAFPPRATGRGLTTYIPGITTTPRLPAAANLPNRRVLPAAPTSSLRFSQPTIGHQMAPITVHSAGASTKIIKVSDSPGVSSFPSYVSQPRWDQTTSNTSSDSTVRSVVPTATSVRPALGTATAVRPALTATSTIIRHDGSTRTAGGTILVNTPSGAKLVRLVTQDGSNAVVTPSTSRLIPAKISTTVQGTAPVSTTVSPTSNTSIPPEQTTEAASSGTPSSTAPVQVPCSVLAIVFRA